MNHQPREDQNKRREVAMGPWRLTAALTGTKEDTASREKESKATLAVCGRSSGQWQREGHRSSNSTRESMMNSAALAEKNSQYWKVPAVSCAGRARLSGRTGTWCVRGPVFTLNTEEV